MLLIVVLLMFCLRTVESKECNKSEIIEGRLGEELVLNFPFSDPRDEYNKYIPGKYGQKIIQNKIQIQNLTKESDMRFRNMKNFRKPEIKYNGSWAEQSLFLTADTIAVKIKELQEFSATYWIEFNSSYLYPVLKAEDNYSTILQLECHGVSTSRPIGDCQLVNNSMYMIWYINGMRMTKLDPTLSQINVTVDHNVKDLKCVATEYRPCYHRLQTTQNYDGFNISGCDNVYESETDSVTPQDTISVKQEPDQRKITVSNSHGERKKKFSSSVTETENDVLMSAEMNTVIIAVSVVIGIVIIVAVIVVVIMVFMYKKYLRKKTDYRVVYRKERKNKKQESVIYAELDLATPTGFKIRGSKPQSEVQYSTVDFTRKAPPMPKSMEPDSDSDVEY